MRTPSFGESTGTVTRFDSAGGLGEITAADGATYPFHCTSIADGSRHAAVDQAVTFTISAGHLGRLEATDIR
ncbi:MAG TPA: hypothetical protein VMZ22_09725 [Acidimicrobiales bacterium]|nr:hypothetical protein [Acidimicrobiales bacterium]